MKLVSVHKQLVLILIFYFGYFNVHAQVWTLQQCLDSARVYNKTLLIGRNNAMLGEQRVMEAKANLLPKIVASADYRYYTNLPYQLLPLSTFNPTAPEGEFKEAQFGVPHNINANIQGAMPLFNPQVNGAISTTKVAAELSHTQYKKTEEQIYFDLSNLYYNAQILHHQLSFIDSNLANTHRLLSNINLLKERQLAKGTDVSKVKLQISQLKTQHELAESKLIQVLNALKLAMGLSLEKAVQIDPNIVYKKSTEYASLVSSDIKLIQAQNRLLVAELKSLERSRILPTLNLTALFGTTGFGYDRQPNSFLKFYPIGFGGLQVNYPIFNGTVTKQKINQKKLEIRNNELQIQVVTDQNSIQIENAKQQQRAMARSVETSQEQIDLAQQIYQQTLLQQKQGLATLTDVLLADNALRESQQSFLNAVIEYLKADLELKKLTGNI